MEVVEIVYKDLPKCILNRLELFRKQKTPKHLKHLSEAENLNFSAITFRDMQVLRQSTLRIKFYKDFLGILITMLTVHYGRKSTALMSRKRLHIIQLCLVWGQWSSMIKKYCENTI